MRVRRVDNGVSGRQRAGAHRSCSRKQRERILDSLASDLRNAERAPRERTARLALLAAMVGHRPALNAPSRRSTVDQGARKRSMASAEGQPARGTAREDMRVRECDLITCCVASPTDGPSNRSRQGEGVPAGEFVPYCSRSAKRIQLGERFPGVASAIPRGLSRQERQRVFGSGTREGRQRLLRAAVRSPKRATAS